MIDLVLVHPFPFDARAWVPLARALPVEVRVHAPDLPGFGLSTQPAAASVDAMADAVRAFLETAGLRRFVLGGLSMGGYVTLAYWRRHVDLRPWSMVLADTRAEADGEATRRGRDETVARLRAEESLDSYAERMLPALVSSHASAEVRQQVRALITAQRWQTAATACLALRDRRDERPTLPSIDVPTLVLCGADDAVTPPASMRALAASVATAHYEELPEAGHLPLLEQPIRMAEAVQRFLVARKNIG